MKNYTNFRLFLILFVFFSFLSAEILSSQYMPVLTTERGDTLQYTYPIPDSVYKHDEIII